MCYGTWAGELDDREFLRGRSPRRSHDAAKIGKCVASTGQDCAMAREETRNVDDHSASGL